MTDTPEPPHPVRQAQKPPRKRKAHIRTARPSGPRATLVRHGLQPGPKPNG